MEWTGRRGADYNSDTLVFRQSCRSLRKSKIRNRAEQDDEEVNGGSIGRDATYSMLSVRCVFTVVGGVERLRVLRLGVMHDDKDGLLYTTEGLQ
jgi:hypothetical protein